MRLELDVSQKQAPSGAAPADLRPESAVFTIENQGASTFDRRFNSSAAEDRRSLASHLS